MCVNSIIDNNVDKQEIYCNSNNSDNNSKTSHSTNNTSFEWDDPNSQTVGRCTSRQRLTPAYKYTG